MPHRPAPAATLALYRLLPLISVVAAASAASVPSLCDAEACHCDGATGAVTCSCAGREQQELSLGAEDGGFALPVNTASLHVERCANVTVGAGAVSQQGRLRLVHVAHVAQLRLRTAAFGRDAATLETYGALPPLAINIERSNVTSIESFAFRDRIEDILLHALHIEYIAPFSFASLGEMDRLEIINCTIDKIEGQAFKRFSVDTFIIAGGTISGEVHSRTLSDVTVMREMHIDGLTMEEVRSRAFEIEGPQVFTLRACNINRTHGEAFRVVVRGPVEIRNNYFSVLDSGAFAGLAVDGYSLRLHNLRRVTFENNTVEVFQKGSLRFNKTGLDIVLRKIVVNQPCSCSSLEEWSSYLQKDVQYIQLKESASLSTEEILWCIKQEPQKRAILFRDFQMLQCSAIPSGLNLFLLIIIPICVLLLVIGICIILMRRKQIKNRKHWVSVPTSNNSKGGDENKTSKDKSETPENRLKLVVPDGRTYRETELHVIVERAEPITDNYLTASNDGK
ncbi:uncharacterized protein LOC126187523 [Schistocerca cancellata]|uniref:uncharacterized protein LOC126187523 n=1 Tax=Schistocerca cancellata TaxID=274614 RepID=UPI0021192272|nr:uncharacterized protein LOC126187523 [Schistocerca cancellata]